MTLKTRGWLVGAWLLTATACEVETVDEADEPDADIGFRPGPPPPTVEEQVCPAWRHIGRIKADHSCGDIVAETGKWKGSYLFEATAPTDLARYCVYEFTKDNPTDDDLETLSSHPKFDEIDNDCFVTQPQATMLDSLGDPLRELTVDRLDLVDETLVDPDAQAKVLVTVADTVPSSRPSDANSDHGIVLAELIEDIAHGCASSSLCDVVVRNQLALPRVGMRRKDIDTARGGFVASYAEIGKGLYDGIKFWKSLPNPRPRHVINMSFAWLPSFGGDSLSDQPPRVDAFHDALQYANCSGALVFVAAGNDKDDCEVDPMFPAAFEQEPEPTDDRCDDLDMPRPNYTYFGAEPEYRPLVHSVGGTDVAHNAFTFARKGGQPRLAAYAEQVVGPDVTKGPRTGTSMATAAYSGAAAAIWSYNPTMPPAEVADVLYRTGATLDGDPFAQYQLGGDLQAIHELSVCKALSEACETTLGCPFSTPLDCVGGSLELDDLHDALTAIAPDHAWPLPLQKTSLQCPGYCGATKDTWFQAGAPGICPELDGESRSDYLVWPQPPLPGCMACSWKTETTAGLRTTSLFGSLVAEYAGDTVIDAVVYLTINGKEQDFPLGAIDLVATSPDSFQIRGVPTGTVTAGKVVLTIQDGSERVTTEDALVNGNLTLTSGG